MIMIIVLDIERTLIFCNFLSVLLTLDPCKQRLCEHLSQCIKRADDTTECVCPACATDDQYSPVCGNDGKTYASQCELEAIACQERKTTRTVKKAACGELLHVDFYLNSIHR